MLARIALAVLAGLAIATPTAWTDPAAAPQCQFGPDVTADCPVGGCAAGVLGQAEPCTGPALEPLLPASPPVRVELGVGSG